MLMLSIGLADLIPICAHGDPPVPGAASARLLEFLADHPGERPVRGASECAALPLTLKSTLRRLGEPDDVVHDHRRLVTVQVGELEGLVIDQDQDRLLRGKEGVRAGLGGDGLGSRASLGIEIALFAPWISLVYCSMIIQ